MVLTLAWYCSRITWPGNSGSGTAANFRTTISNVWSPERRSWSLWSVAAIKAIRIKSAKCNTKKSSEKKIEIKKENSFIKFKFIHNIFYKTAHNVFKMNILHFTLPHTKDLLKALYTYNNLSWLSYISWCMLPSIWMWKKKKILWIKHKHLYVWGRFSKSKFWGKHLQLTREVLKIGTVFLLVIMQIMQIKKKKVFF